MEVVHWLIIICYISYAWNGSRSLHWLFIICYISYARNEACPLVGLYIITWQSRDVAGNEEVVLKRDTQREDEIKAIKAAWEELQPGRAEKV